MKAKARNKDIKLRRKKREMKDQTKQADTKEVVYKEPGIKGKYIVKKSQANSK